MYMSQNEHWCLCSCLTRGALLVILLDGTPRGARGVVDFANWTFQPVAVERTKSDTPEILKLSVNCIK